MTKSKLNDSAIDAPALLRFETVRSILEDSKGNYWFGSWKEGVCRFDGKSLTYFTVEDGLSDNQIRSIHEDRNGVVWFEGGVGISGFDGEKIITPTSRNYTSKDEWLLGTGDLWFKEDGSCGATEIEGQPGVYRYDGKTFTYLAYPLPADRATGRGVRDHRHCQGKRREALVRHVHRGDRIRRRVLHHHRRQEPGPQRGHRLASRPLRPRGQQGKPLDREQWDRSHPA